MPEDAAFKGWFGSTRNTFPFTTIWSHENFIDEIVGLLPTSEEAELLLTAFLDEIAVLFKAWHLPTLIEDYRAFFALPTSEKRTQPLANLSLFVMVCSLGSMVRASIGEIFGHSGNSNATSPVVNMIPHNGKDHTSSRLQSELYLSAAFQALRLCSFLANPTIATIQSQVLVNIYLIHSERAADAWSLTGSLVRQCIAIGLHVDPTTWDSRISLREAEVRRRIWWSVVGLDCLLCVSYGRPPVTNYWTCQLPMDRPDDMLSDEPGSALAVGPTNNALASEVTDETFHAAYFQLTIPSLDLLNRVFHVDPRAARESFMGWFPATTQNQDLLPMTATSNTYEDAIRLGRDIFEWYAHVPRGMRFEPDDNSEDYLNSRSGAQINQTLALAVKTFMLVLILHRPYLRADPTEYPESADLCYRAAHIILSAYTVMSRTKSSIVWSWWTMSYRAFHAGAVCAFLVVRDPGTEVAERCLQGLRNAIQVFEGRKSNWNVNHPVQGDLCAGLAQLEKLATAATEQYRTSPLQHHPSVPSFPPQLSQVSAGVEGEGLGLSTNGPLGNEAPEQRQAPLRRRTSELPFLQPWQMSAADPNLNTGNQPAHEPLSQIWASMFSVKLDPESIANAPIQAAPV
ncbi:hypothetical protein VHUM_03350 [Vanrija humicola]|uniref:Xylanolytic transcriptional activator regulatory domain-containing protein n=1 Tax=Vanrija humicola TaxID=5417 RepID=A0A7D8YXA9_VANHU|nr:hypothetical protein VHUM_03350 [Vanrija humicola]